MVIQNTPKNLKDPKSFTLPTQIDESKVVHTLSDLGMNINLISLSMFKTLGLGESKLIPLMI